MNTIHWSALPLYAAPALINFALFFYVLLCLPVTKVNRLFVIFVFLLGVEQAADCIMHVSGNLETASMWQHLALAPWVFIAPVGALMLLTLAQAAGMQPPSWTYPAMVIPAFVCQFMIAARLDSFVLFDDPMWGWVSNPVSDWPTITIFLYICVAALLMPLISWYAFVRTRKNLLYRNQFLLLAIGITIPYIGGVVAEVVLPLFFGINNTPLTGPLVTVFSVCSIIAIRKYKMLDFSPRHQFDRILETMTEGVLILDSSGKIMYTNPSMCGLLGYSVEELQGEYSAMLTTSGESSILNISSQAAEIQLLHKNGTPVWTLVNTSPCLDSKGQPIGLVFTVTNITELRKTAAEAMRNESRLNRAQEVARIGSWELNLNARVSYWSDEACRIYGLPEEQNIHSFEKWASMIHPADLGKVMIEIEHAKETLSDLDVEHRIVRPDGSVKYIQSISRYELDEHGKPCRIYGICKDITEMKMAEEKLKATSRELETYIYKSSHDMHAPLSSILGLVNVSRMEIFDPVAVRYLGMIETQAKKLDNVRSDFIKAMHIKDASKLNEEIYLNQMIGDILKNLRMKDGFARLNINVNVPPGEKLIANEFLMRTILQNLIENSIKYQDYNQERSTLQIDLEKNGDTAKITIEDNGVGIKPELQDKVFDMYFKTTESREGAGLGLYLVKKAVEKLDGRMQLRSSPGQGTKFTLSFAQSN